jgi:hypothetical protein
MRLLWIRAGRDEGRGRVTSAGLEYVNAPAARCSVHRGSLGRRFVRYQGCDYTVTGLYYASRPWQKPCPFFVLRRIEGEAAAPVWRGDRWKPRRAVAVRAVTCAVIIAVVLAWPAWIASRPSSSVPPAAHAVTPLTAW